MDFVAFLLSAENIRTLILFVTIIGGFYWFDRRIDLKIGVSEKRQDQKMDGLGVSLRQEMDGLGVSLRQEINGLNNRIDVLDNRIDVSEKSLREEISGLNDKISILGTSLRQEMDNSFIAFHKTLKENDFAHLNKTIEALTFMLQKNGILDPEDKKYIDSHLDGK